MVLALAATARAADKEPASEQEFVVRSIACDLAEIRMAERALKASSNEDIKSFARQMKADHTKHRKQLMSMAKSMKIEVTEGMTKEAQDELAKLTKLEGKEFDKAYVKCQLMAHEKVLKMNEKWAKDAGNQKVRDTASKTAETVREHLAHVKKLNPDS